LIYATWLYLVTLEELFRVKDYHSIAESAGSPIEEDPKHDVYVLESDYLTLDQRRGGGCQLVPLKSWLIDYESYYKRVHLIIRRLVFPGRQPSDLINFPNLEKFLIETSSKTYKTSKRQMANAVVKLNRSEDLSSVFCSELVAATLKSMEMVKSDLNCTNITPKDFDRMTYQHRLHVNHSGKDDFEVVKGYLMEPFRLVFNMAKYTQKVRDAVGQAPPFQLKQE